VTQIPLGSTSASRDSRIEQAIHVLRKAFGS
jgi:hypothetical protein